ncbi:MAG: GntR family transcriptional regulator [Clostridium sp.]
MSNSEYLYMNIYRDLKNGILEGRYNISEKLPTEKELSNKYNVSRITCQKAMNLLVEEKLVVRHPGIGTIVADTKHENSTEEKHNNEQSVMLQTHKSTKIIGLVVEAIWDCFGIGIFDGAYDMAQKLGYNLIIKKSFGNQAKEVEAIEELIGLGAEGIIVMPVHGDYYSEKILELVVQKYPILFIDRFLKGIHVPFVGIDNQKASMEAVNYLVDRGHKEIGLITCEDNQATTLDARKKGYVDGIVNNGLIAKRRYIYNELPIVIPEVECSEMLNREINNIEEYIKENAEITALLTTEFYMAKVCKLAIKNLKKRIPEDIEIICFDSPAVYLGEYEFTTVVQNEKEMGRKAVENLYDIIAGKDVEFVSYVDAKIVKGRSTKG